VVLVDLVQRAFEFADHGWVSGEIMERLEPGACFCPCR